MARVTSALSVSLWSGGFYALHDEDLTGSLMGAVRQLPARVTRSTLITPITFSCGLYRAKSSQQCQARSGHCPSGTQCMNKEDDRAEICCCDTLTTPVLNVTYNDWQCSVQAICDVGCCENQGSLGRDCAWTDQWGWPFALPGSSSRVCCVDLAAARCQTSCWLPKLLWLLPVPTTLCAGAIIQHNWRSWWGTHLRKTTVVLCAQFLVTGGTARFVGNPRLGSICWAALTCLPPLLQYLHLRRRRKRELHNREDSEERTVTEGQQLERIAVLLVIERYDAYPLVEDRSALTLARELADRGWDVRLYSVGVQSDFECIRDTVQTALRGMTAPEVLLYVSCHSIMVSGVPVILQSDAGRTTAWYKSKSLYTMLWEFNEAKPEHAKFLVFFNGCLVEPTCEPWWRFVFCACRARENLPALKMGRTKVSIFFACAPGSPAFDDQMSKALVEALQAGEGRSPIFDSLQRRLESARIPQRLVTIGNEHQIILG